MPFADRTALPTIVALFNHQYLQLNEVDLDVPFIPRFEKCMEMEIVLVRIRVPTFEERFQNLWRSSPHALRSIMRCKRSLENLM